MKYIVDIKGEIEGDYEIIGKYEERPQGKWVFIADVYCTCPFCSNVEVKFPNYCPECGAELRNRKEV